MFVNLGKDNNLSSAFDQARDRIDYLRRYISDFDANADTLRDLEVAREELKAETQHANMLMRKLVAASTAAA